MPAPFTSYQKFVVLMLAFLQFTIILDFMIMAPIGAILMPALKITPAQFSLVVSAYAFSAAASGILAAGVADRFDRKKLLLFFYTGFLVGTLVCGLAPDYHVLLIARLVTGIFGGVIGAIVLAITTDLFAYEQRGRVMGLLSTAFAASQILGVPAGLYFSALWGWHAPFLMIVAFGIAAGVFIVMRLKPVDQHLSYKIDKSPFHHLWSTIATPRYQLGLAVTGMISIGGFLLMPLGSAFMVNNVGISLEELPLVYLSTGLAAIVFGPLMGRAADAIGKFPVFIFGMVVSAVSVVIYTHLGTTPLAPVIAINVVLFIGIMGRMVTTQALVSALPARESRGSFMAVSSSLQQFTGGLASILSGLIVTETAGGKLEHFEVLGYIIVVTGLISTFMIYRVQKTVVASLAPPATTP